MKAMSVEQRRARLGVRHHLARPARSVETVAHDLVGLHATDPATVFLSARARTKDFHVADLERALYEDRTLVRMLGMRRTMFVVPTDVAAVMDSAVTQALAPGQRTRTIRMIEEGGLAKNGTTWLARAERKTLAALEERGEATASELSKVVPELTAKVTFGEGKTWGGEVGMSTRVLFLLATEGRIVRGRPRGSWISSQYRWAPVRTWLGHELDSLPRAEARAALARRWLHTYGPATRTDLAWWTGWSGRDTTAALEAADVVEVELATGTGYVLADDTAAVRAPRDWVAFLPALDPTIMGWKERDWYLGDHAPALFDRNGNAGPTVVHAGRVVGGWTQRKDGSVVYELLEKVAAGVARTIANHAQEVERWLGDVRITPRFRTPLERALGRD